MYRRFIACHGPMLISDCHLREYLHCPPIGTGRIYWRVDSNLARHLQDTEKADHYARLFDRKIEEEYRDFYD